MPAEIIGPINELLQRDILAAIGLLIAIAFLGSKLFQRVGFPQVVGFIIIGVVLGPSFLNLIPLELSDQLGFISQIALGLIGFDIGSHLRYDELRTLGGGLLVILIFEALGTFVIVTAGMYALTQSISTALVFGAISSATAPAATVDVLAEYDAGGPLTTSLLAVVGMDDAIALILFSITAALAETTITGSSAPSLLTILKMPVVEIGGALLLGGGLGVFLDQILRRMKSHHDSMAVSIGFVFIGIGLSHALEFSMILTAMIMGCVLVNLDPFHTRRIRFTIEQAGPVIYVLFFSLVGARFQISLLPAMGIMGVVYILMRSGGKYAGAWVGGWLGRAPKVVRDNLGFGLMSQAGVAIGLAIASAERFTDLGPEGRELAGLIVNVVTATTFVVQVIGPLFVKYAIRQAGEVGGAKLSEDVWASEGAPE